MSARRRPRARTLRPQRVPEGFTNPIDPPAAQTASGTMANIPGDFYTHIGMREFFAQKFPYWTDVNIDQTESGIAFAQGIGGAISQYLGNWQVTGRRRSRPIGS
jgi:hypothetical protein